MRLMLVEDDDRVAAALMDGLRRQSIEVVRASTGRAAMSEVGDGSGFDVILLDLGLPDQDGLSVCRQLREVADVPIIMVTARTDMRTRVHGLHLGADDYVTKPFDLRELLARIHAVVRRSGPARVAGAREPGAPGPSALGIAIDRERREVTVHGTPVTLTRKEFNLLAMLARQPGVVFSRAHIISEVWDSAWTGHQRTLEVHVASVRAKLGVPEAIETVRGVGYRFPAS
jgi:DNA-binding response OmpR family regulator